MKKKVCLLLAMCIFCSFINLNTNVAKALESPLSFTDHNLNDIFCDFVGKSHGSVVYKTEIDNKMKKIYLNDPYGYNYELNINGVSDLSGMEQLNDLAHPFRYIIIGSKINSLEPIKGFKLKTLILTNTNNNIISMFNEESNLRNSLINLEINNSGNNSDCILNNIESISRVVNLKSLSITNTDVLDIRPIAKLSSLESLTLDSLCKDNNDKKVKISELSSMNSLKELALGRLKLTKDDLISFSEPNAFNNLEKLIILNESNIKDISYLKNRKNINYLELHDCGLDDRSLDIISSMSQIRFLDLSLNRISNIKKLGLMTKITNLNLSDNDIEDVSTLEDLTHLRQLFLSTNYITDIAPLTKLIRLDTLKIDNNFIDIFKTQKDNLSKIKTSWGVTSIPQRIVVGINNIEMNIGDTLTYSGANSKSIYNYSGNVLVDIKQTSDGKDISDYNYHVPSYKYNFSINTPKVIVESNSNMTKLSAVASGQAVLTTLLRNIDSPFTKANTAIRIAGTLKGSITVRYVDESGNDIMSEDIFKNLELGKYKEKAINIDGYIIDGEKNKEVTLTEEKKDQVVTFKYKESFIKPLVMGSIITKYKDEGGSDIIAPDFTNGLSLATYSRNAKSLEGYILNDSSIKNITLTDNSPDQIIIFNYRKDRTSKPIIRGSITIKFQDENGQEIIVPKVLNNLEMGSYTEHAMNFSGYKLDGLEEESITLTQTNKDQVIIFKYNKERLYNIASLPKTGSILYTKALIVLGLIITVIGIIIARIKIAKVK